MTKSMYYQRRQTRTVFVGQIGIGGLNPIRIQSMTTSDTKNTEALIREMKELQDAGCEIIRVTVPTKADCANLPNIRAAMKKEGIRMPVVADIHFTPTIAMDVVPFVDKVRINPGNFVDKKLFNVREYSDEQYQQELERIEEKFTPLVLKCKEYGIAMRIGTNHGSLSDRIMNRYGDTPQGMVESAVEFLKIAAKNDYHEIILSMKASNTQVMVAAYRLLAKRLAKENMDYPFHLGVTEAGDGEDARIKSAVGIGTLLEEGIGDTIRVSLTEDSVHEIPVAGMIAATANQKFYTKYFSKFKDQTPANLSFLHENRFAPTYTRRDSKLFITGLIKVGGKEPLRVWTRLDKETDFPAFLKSQNADMQYEGIEIPAKIYSKKFIAELKAQNFPVAVISDNASVLLECADVDKKVFLLKNQESISQLVKLAKDKTPVEVCANPDIDFHKVLKEIDTQSRSFSLITNHPAQDYRILAHVLAEHKNSQPIHLRYQENEIPTLVDVSIQLGSLILDGIGDSIQIDAAPHFKERLNLSFGLLQACRVRISKTEFIACPSCGRTLFDLQEVTAKIKSKTSHLKGVKIAIMGCIVNGPGEMADADFGYVGTGTGKISLYVGKECVQRNIPEENALEDLIGLIKTHGAWVDEKIQA